MYLTVYLSSVCVCVCVCQAAFSQLEVRGLRPDVASFGCLAMAVRNMNDMDEFMDRLKAAELRWVTDGVR